MAFPASASNFFLPPSLRSLRPRHRRPPARPASPPPLPQFEYSTLTEDQIRILKLLPGSDSDPVSCEFEIAPRESAPRYSALTYAWGTPPSTKKAITITKVVTNGTAVACNQGLSVWPNLHSALVALRHGSVEPQRFWIDALCIDQECEKDPEKPEEPIEKDNQVRRMNESTSIPRVSSYGSVTSRMTAAGCLNASATGIPRHT